MTSHFLLVGLPRLRCLRAGVGAISAHAATRRRSSERSRPCTRRTTAVFDSVGVVFETAPQIPARHRAVRTPGFADLRIRSGVGLLAQPVEPLDGVDDAEIVDRQHVGPPQPEHQEHLRRPAAEPLHLDDRVDHLVVGHRGERSSGQLAARDLRGEVAQVGRSSGGSGRPGGTGRRSAPSGSGVARRPASARPAVRGSSRPLWSRSAAR